jgi:hypothetical protein
MSDLSYRDKDNQPIDFNKWQELKASEVASVTVVFYQDKNITVNKKYFGLIGSVFKVWVDVSSDIIKYHGYIKHYEGETESTNDYLRLIDAIENDSEIFDSAVNNGLFSIIFDPKWNQHIVCDQSNYPEVDYCYGSRAEAEIKLNNLIGG